MSNKYDAEFAAKVSRFLDAEIGPSLYVAEFSLEDNKCDARIYSRKRIETDMQELGLLQGETIGRVNLILMDLNALDFDIKIN